MKHTLQLIVSFFLFLDANAGDDWPNHHFLRALAEDFLEFEPYWDHSQVKTNMYNDDAPFIGKVVSTKRIVGPKAGSDTYHIIIDHDCRFPFIEGQSLGVVPPGTDHKHKNKTHDARIFSIASSRYGDDMTGKTLSLCVHRETCSDLELQAMDQAKKWICSNFLCDTKPGDEVLITGPFDKTMLMPEEDPNTDIIMIASGVGVAPFRGFVRRLFFEDTPASRAFKGEAWLFLIVANIDALLYDDEFQDAKARFPKNFRLDYALGNDQDSSLPDKMNEYADEILAKLAFGAHIYFSGLSETMPGIHDMFKHAVEERGLKYHKWIKDMEKQWHET